MEGSGVEMFLAVLKDGSAITFFAVGIWAFVKGWVMPKTVVDKMLEHSSTQTELLAITLSTKYLEGTEKAVHAGVVAAVEEIRNGDK